ncbi:C5a anaphylatoxin chemotactic receptor 1-like [Sinocyclocheilus grahami]|uniref:C5a anaphylatoxin chemotactic receptor 1-like n=1 Tax=Sinocyclocheilus grahami TaxID=75366 RepID=UPI0007ACC037|nr:PREDICTED: C5a anaphylatoxin chemotactic receptor 1-like [Sinocyclocheilus grahami]XP_016150002.1 PREDICTED: C5a anaphylatoxin chemotactic receptor 1-like [Sinocyclocheilus grahami]
MEEGDYIIPDYSSNDTDWCEGVTNCTPFVLPTVTPLSRIGSRHWIALVCYLIVFLLGVPGNALVVWVTALRMPNSVNAQWFLNLAIADLLCCLSLPLLMVPLAQDQHWPYGALACKLLSGLLYMMMYCSVLLLVVISLDRFLLVTKPVWCQNHRNTRQARCVCLVIWILALLAGSPQFAHMEMHEMSKTKTVCHGRYSDSGHAWSITLTRCFLSFLLPFLIICISHWKVFITMSSGRGHRGSDKSARTLRVILALVLSFFLCWIPLNIVDILLLMMQGQSESITVNLRLAHVLTLCLAYINSCLNPLLYVCLGRGFKKNLISSLRSVIHFASEAPSHGISMTATSKSTTDGFREKPL